MKNSKAIPFGTIEFNSLGDSAVLLRFGSVMNETVHLQVRALAAQFSQRPFSGMVEYVPAIASIAVHYDPIVVLNNRTLDERMHATIYDTVCARITGLIEEHGLQEGHAEQGRTIEIPVCYDGEFGPDLSFVAKHNGLTEEEVVAIHLKGTYHVYMIGFAPGFPYLGGMSERIAAPRRQTPRTKIPVGSVGIAGGQTGIYSIATPGGWQLIGRTPLELFRPQHSIPTLLKVGDMIKFKPITRLQYEQYKEGAL